MLQPQGIPAGHWRGSLACAASCRLGQGMAQRMQHTTDFLSSPANSANVLVVLNFELPRFTPSVWDQDGGANRLYYDLPRLLPEEDPVSIRKKYKPDAIVGDLDSIQPEVRAFYENLGTTIVDKGEDQDTTDLHKCVTFIMDRTPLSGGEHLRLLVVGALGGRFDHEQSNINVLFTFCDLQILLLGHESLLFLLPRGYHHDIHLKPPSEHLHCGLIPVGRPSASTTTTGLKWNLDATPMAFGSLISTSNRPVSNKVTVHSDADLVWTIEIPRAAEADNLNQNHVEWSLA